MTGALGPRVVIITRETDYELLLARHATVGMARFYLRSRAQTIDETERRHLAQQAALTELKAAIPREWRVANVPRAELDRFIFAAEDVVVAVGPDGLVANVAKYLSGQPVIGVNPEPDRYPGVLVQHSVSDAIRLLAPAAAGSVATEDRTMLRASLDSGQALLALNEVFVGHETHQSARYLLSHGAREENQSSSGLIVSSGTGSTGWALSISRATGFDADLAPTDRAAMFLVREPWPSPATGASLAAGRLDATEALRVTSRMSEHGVVFADGMEQDRLPFGWGAILSVQVAEQRLRLVPSENRPVAVRSTTRALPKPVVGASREAAASGPAPVAARPRAVAIAAAKPPRTGAELGVLIHRPVARFLAAAFLPWASAVVLGSVLWGLVPEHVLYEEPGDRPMTTAVRFEFFWYGLFVLSIFLTPAFLVLGTPAKLALHGFSKRIAPLWRGRLLAGVWVSIGMALALPVADFGLVFAFEDQEHRLALCQQWDTGKDGQWLSGDPRCGSSAWDWSLALIPGGGAGFVYWLVRYRPRQALAANAPATRSRDGSLRAAAPGPG